MVPQVVRLQEAGTCSCGTVVPAGERAGTTRQPGLVVCLSCVAAFSGDPEVADVADSTDLDDSFDDSRGAVAAEPAAEEALDDPTPVPEPVAVVIPADWGPSSPSSLPSWQREAGVTVTLPPAAPVSTHAFASAAPRIAVKLSSTALADLVAASPAEPRSSAPADPEDAPAAAVDAPLDAVDAPETPEIPAVAPAVVPPPRPSAPPEPAEEPLVPAAVTAPHTEPVDVPAPVVAPVAVQVPVAVVEASVTEAVAVAVPSHRRRTILPAGLLALRSSRGREPGTTGQSDPAMRAFLDSASEGGVLALHDRRMPGRRGRIAHLAFGAGGVYVIDVVRAKNASVEVRIVDELDHDTHELVVDGRSMNTTVSATQGRVEIVRALLDEVELTTVPVIGVMCFVDATVPEEGDLAVAGVHVTGRSGLPALVGAEGALEADHRETLLEYLTERLPAA